MPRKPLYRVYGNISGITEDTFQKILHDLPFAHMDLKDNVLDIEHEGSFTDVDHAVEVLVAVMSPTGKGRIDFIDEPAWTLTRYHLLAGDFQKQKIDLNDALDKYIYE